MMVHLDASRHGWLPQLPMQDLVVAMDDADGRILYARFVPEENTASTLAALKHLLRRYGRFAGALHRSRQSLLLHAQGGDGPHHRAWRGRQPGAEGAGDPPAAGLVPASARAQRARLRDQSRAACRRSCGWRGVAATSTPTPT